jgi:hypothetical protein
MWVARCGVKGLLVFGGGVVRSRVRAAWSPAVACKARGHRRRRRFRPRRRALDAAFALERDLGIAVALCPGGTLENAMPNGSKAAARPSEAEIRQRVMADPNTHDIASMLGMPLEQYVAMVVDYALHPGRQPSLNVLPEEEVKRQGGATVVEVRDWLRRAAQAAPIAMHGEDGFDGTNHNDERTR